MANKLIQVKASGMMCSFCTMSVEKALKRLDGVENVQVNLVHGIILVEGDPARVHQEQVSNKVRELGYTTRRTETALHPPMKRQCEGTGSRPGSAG